MSHVVRLVRDEPLLDTDTSSELLEALPEALAVLDGDWCVIRVNHAMERLTGLRREMALGVDARELLPIRSTALEIELQRAMSTRLRTRIELRLAPTGRSYVIQAWALGSGVAVHVRDVTRSRADTAALMASEERYRALVERSPEAIAVHRDGVLVYANRAGATLVGAASPARLVGAALVDLIHPDDHHRIRARREDFSDDDVHECEPVEVRLTRLDGQVLEAEIVSVPVIYNGRAAIQSVVRDVTERRQAERAVRAGEERAREAEMLARATAHRMRAVASAAAGVMAADSLDALHCVLREACAAALPFDNFTFGVLDEGRDTLQFPAGPSSPIPNLVVPVAGTACARVIAERRSLVMLGEEVQSLEPTTHGDGRQWQSVIRTPVLADNAVLGILSVYSTLPGLYSSSDVEVVEVVAALASTALRNIRLVDEIRRSEERLTHQAFHDPLTGLANRALFLDRVGHALTRSVRPATSLAVLFIDLDDFKKVNDSLGHPAGDRLLVVAAERLSICVRSSDTVARLGGDEFAVLVEDARGPSDVLAVAERVAAALRQPFHVNGAELFVSASIGIAPAEPGGSADELLRNADVAMYFAKTRGKSATAVFEPWMQTAAYERLQLEADMRRGLSRDEFVLHYQPIVQLDTGRVTGVEALVRWEHPERGMVSPADFIPLAEETGLIVPLGRWVLEQACRQLRAWQREMPAGSPRLRVSVNLSGRQLQEPDVVETVRSALADSGLAPSTLVLEITESVLMQHTALTLARLRELKSLGLSLAIDDFGTGYSSLGYLQRFPIDILKIDKAFVDAVGGDSDAALARAVIALGDTLGMQTVAEGIEGATQVTGLRDLGCQFGQGFFYSRPLPPQALHELLQLPGKAVGQHP